MLFEITIRLPLKPPFLKIIDEEQCLYIQKTFFMFISFISYSSLYQEALYESNLGFIILGHIEVDCPLLKINRFYLHISPCDEFINVPVPFLFRFLRYWAVKMIVTGFIYASCNLTELT